MRTCEEAWTEYKKEMQWCRLLSLQHIDQLRKMFELGWVARGESK